MCTWQTLHTGCYPILCWHNLKKVDKPPKITNCKHDQPCENLIDWNYFELISIHQNAVPKLIISSQCLLPMPYHKCTSYQQWHYIPYHSLYIYIISNLGYNRENSDVAECLRLGYEELENNAEPQYLNRKFHGRLSESNVYCTSTEIRYMKVWMKVHLHQVCLVATWSYVFFKNHHNPRQSFLLSAALHKSY